jgi:hypothetical protein
VTIKKGTFPIEGQKGKQTKKKGKKKKFSRRLSVQNSRKRKKGREDNAVIGRTQKS